MGRHLGIVRVASAFVDIEDVKKHMPANATIIAELIVETPLFGKDTHLKIECPDFPEVKEGEKAPFFTMWLHKFSDCHVEFEKWERVNA
jgi:hypothetical protein